MTTGLTLSTLRTALREYIDDRNATRFGNDQCLNFLNRGQEVIQDIIDGADENFFSACQQYDVVANTDSYEFTLPTNFKKLILVERLVTGSEPVPFTYVDFRRRHASAGDYIAVNFPGLSIDSGEYYLRGNKFGIVAPTSSYTVRAWYTYRIPDLVNDGDISEIPKEYCNLVAMNAAILSKGERVGNAGALPDELAAEYTAGIERLRSYIEARQRQGSRYVVYDGSD